MLESSFDSTADCNVLSGFFGFLALAADGRALPAIYVFPSIIDA
jgi:hypothetical protein